jgi:hypothetical protein
MQSVAARWENFSNFVQISKFAHSPSFGGGWGEVKQRLVQGDACTNHKKNKTTFFDILVCVNGKNIVPLWS